MRRAVRRCRGPAAARGGAPHVSFGFLLPLCLLLQASLPNTAPGASDELRGSVSGRVLSARTNQPLKGATVQIYATLHGQFRVETVTTGADGAFSFQRLPAGSYTLNADKTGYRESEGLSITIDDKQSKNGSDIKLWPTAVIAGRVNDPDGLPVVGALVTLYRHRWAGGRRVVERAGQTRTDDRGAYRLFGLEPGRYVVAGSRPPEDLPSGEVDLGLASTFYPSGASPAEAAPLELRWGQELPGIDLALRQQQTFSIAGLVADAESGGPCGTCLIRAESVQEALRFAQREVGVGANGSYRVRGLLPGDYRIVATKPTGRRQHVVAVRIVHLRDQNVRDAHLVVGAGHRVTGRVVLEPAPQESPQGERHIVFSLVDVSETAQIAKVGPEGSFQAEGLSSGTHRIQMRGLPQGSYLKVVRWGGSDLPGPEIEVPEEGNVMDLEVVVAFDSATLAVRVKPSEASGHRVTTAIVAVFPRDSQSRFVTARTVYGDSASGDWITVSGLAPGVYTVFAFPHGGTLEWEDPAVRRQLQNYGKAVDLGAGKKETVEVILAPMPTETQ